MASRAAGTFARRAISAARAPSRLSSPPIPRFRQPPAASTRLQSRRSSSFAPSREWKRRVMSMGFQSAKGT